MIWWALHTVSVKLCKERHIDIVWCDKGSRDSSFHSTSAPKMELSHFFITYAKKRVMTWSTYLVILNRWRGGRLHPFLTPQIANAFLHRPSLTPSALTLQFVIMSLNTNNYRSPSVLATASAPAGAKPSLLKSLSMAGAAAVITVTFIHPIDVVKVS